MNKKLLASAVCLALVTACSQQDSDKAAQTEVKKPAAEKKVATKTTLKSGIELANLDKSVRPQDDFYRYVNGSWLTNTEIPSDKSRYGSFTVLRDKSRKDVKAIIEETAKLENVEKGSDAQKVGDLYRSYMDVKKLDELGVSPILPELEKIGGLQNHDDISAYFAETQMLNSDAPFGFFVNNDSKNPTSYIVYLTQSGLGLPDREYYLKTDEKSVSLRDAYLKHIEKMFQLAGSKTAEQDAKAVMALETEIAKLHWNRVDSRNRDKTYNKVETAKLSELSGEFNWQAYLTHAGINAEKEIIVRQPSYIENFSKLFKATSVDDWKRYLKWTLINAASGILSSEFDQANFAFYGTTLNGTPEQEVRWKRAVTSVNQLLGEVVGKIYVEKHFKPEAKARMVQLVENLREAYRTAIIDLDWMGEETKKQALDKLAKFTPKIGYPDKWRDYSALEISADDLVGNYKRAALFGYHRQINKLGKPIDKTEWFMSPQTVNAYYNPVMNEIVFPAAILQPPFFNMAADDAVNYGGIGGVIGHEMGHGFDDQGSKSDGDGVLRNWWTDKDLEEFKLRTGKLAAQYSAFEPLPGEHINGELTLGENIGDLGGLTIAHRAYKLALKDKAAPEIDGFSGEQRFFMGWAQVWAYKYRDEAMSNQIKTGPHSPANFRGNGPLMNMPEFVKAYDVKATDGMYRKPEDRVKIW
ncbi:M13 family metallopeptidase [Aliikangiella coralliicola]|uniref:Peptidase M13 n=1 Tax=Aliikangiella coralliicola TaxID=2592383 RepID=A0A545UA84_9GAMM|nr:M13-type metalloendopeptidase [Aliikangiella coralliicola]TQV86388.1 peptidase M13 [Aliikangiella coralliicola]